MKYTSMAGIRERNLWRRYLNNLRKVELKLIPHYFTSILNSLNFIGIKDDAIWNMLEEEANNLL